MVAYSPPLLNQQRIVASPSSLKNSTAHLAFLLFYLQRKPLRAVKRPARFCSSWKRCSSSHPHFPMSPHIEIIAQETGLKLSSVAATAKLLEEGGTVPFISRYRKEQTGSLDEVQITTIRDRLNQLVDLDKRREVILKSLDERKLLTEELKKKVLSAKTLSALEDVFAPFRPNVRLVPPRLPKKASLLSPTGSLLTKMLTPQKKPPSSCPKKKKRKSPLPKTLSPERATSLPSASQRMPNSVEVPARFTRPKPPSLPKFSTEKKKKTMLKNSATTSTGASPSTKSPPIVCSPFVVAPRKASSSCASPQILKKSPASPSPLGSLAMDQPARKW